MLLLATIFSVSYLHLLIRASFLNIKFILKINIGILQVMATAIYCSYYLLNNDIFSNTTEILM